MNDPTTRTAETVMQLFSPLMIISPICFAALTPVRAGDDAARAAAAKKGMLHLAIFTGLGLVVWLGLFLASLESPDGLMRSFARATWVLFFPLWFLVAMPAVRAKNPAWGAAIHGTTTASGTTRTASLVNRARENPVGPVAWGFAVAVAAFMFALIAARGRDPFSADEAGRTQHARWLWILLVYGAVALSNLIVTAFSVRRMHAEPEPLDPSGSQELQDLYRAHRVRKIRGLFWMLGVALPGFLGAMMAAMVWRPGDGQIIGLIGGSGGAMIGIGGAVFGCMMTAQRIRIAEFKASLE